MDKKEPKLFNTLMHGLNVSNTIRTWLKELSFFIKFFKYILQCYSTIQSAVFEELENNNHGLPKRFCFNQRMGLVFILCQFRISLFHKVNSTLSVSPLRTHGYEAEPIGVTISVKYEIEK